MVEVESAPRENSEAVRCQVDLGKGQPLSFLLVGVELDLNPAASACGWVFVGGVEDLPEVPHWEPESLACGWAAAPHPPVERLQPLRRLAVLGPRHPESDDPREFDSPVQALDQTARYVDAWLHRTPGYPLEAAD